MPSQPRNQTISQAASKEVGPAGLREVIPAPLFCAGEASSGEMHPDVESSVQGSHRPIGARPKDVHTNEARGETPLLHGQAERAGSVHPGEEKAVGRPESGISVSTGGL